MYFCDQKQGFRYWKHSFILKFAFRITDYLVWNCSLQDCISWPKMLFIFSSQVLFSISQKLIQHQIINYTEILKWLQEILVCRNSFLQKHSSNANIGSNIPVCKQAHIKLEVCIHNTIIYQLLDHWWNVSLYPAWMAGKILDLFIFVGLYII